MLDPRFKNLRLVFFFVIRKEGVSIVGEYDKKTIYPTFLKCYHHLHPLTEFVGCVDQTSDENSSLNIFQQTASTSKPSKELVTKELLIFKRYQMNPKDIKCLLRWWGKHEAMFPTIGLLARQILGIVGSQIETLKKFL
jgi:hypothetical protein